LNKPGLSAAEAMSCTAAWQKMLSPSLLEVQRCPDSINTIWCCLVWLVFNMFHGGKNGECVGANSNHLRVRSIKITG